MAACFVTTLDNPFDYFTEFEDWYNYDTTHGIDVIGEPYNTCAYIARIANTAPGMSQKDYEDAVEEAVDEICRLNLTGNYVKIYDKSTNKEDDNED